MIVIFFFRYGIYSLTGRKKKYNNYNYFGTPFVPNYKSPIDTHTLRNIVIFVYK